MIELVHEKPLQLFRLLTLADIAANLGSADHFCRLIAQWRNGERDVDPPPILGDADRLIVLDALAAPKPSEDVLLFPVQFRRDNPGDRLPYHFVGLVSENCGRTGIPRRDDAIQGLADDGVIGR